MTATKAELAAELEAARQRLAVLEDLLRAISHASDTPLPDSLALQDWLTADAAVNQLRDRLRDISYCATSLLERDPGAISHLPALLREFESRRPLSYPVNQSWAAEHAPAGEPAVTG